MACRGKRSIQDTSTADAKLTCSVKAYHPPGKEDVGHVHVPCLYHLPDLPKPVDECWCLDIRVRQKPPDRLKSLERHEVRHVKRARTGLLIPNLIAIIPVVSYGPSLLGRHKQSDPKKMDHLPKRHRLSITIPPRLLDGLARLCQKDHCEPCHWEEVQEQVEERLAKGGPTIREQWLIVISPRNNAMIYAIPIPRLTFVKVIDNGRIIPEGRDVLWRRIIVTIHLKSLPPNVRNVLCPISCSINILANLDLLLDDFCHWHCISPPHPHPHRTSGNIP